MKTIFHIWITAIIYEAIIFGLWQQEPVLSLLILPFAFFGGLPGLFLFIISMSAIKTADLKPYHKAILILLSTLFAASATLYLFFLLIDRSAFEWGFFWMANGAALLGGFTFCKTVYKKYIKNES
ncbi:hypothetical protein DBR32_13535 [Taibaiella sp. KBW10]|uniref:hypothetical protein n=1 Tax=Taibaiella sp. KBW10 TaxID=2153357 RepID=UPI000F5AD8A9|nr:hypothetical protein [Taibaiella sp. KBW10]RQO30574.1 hypothetical protein DBR32_13535 [Taibaiella sp. KBW10]